MMGVLIKRRGGSRRGGERRGWVFKKGLFPHYYLSSVVENSFHCWLQIFEWSLYFYFYGAEAACVDFIFFVLVVLTP
jgi:hypothetical protein